MRLSCQVSVFDEISTSICWQLFSFGIRPIGNVPSSVFIWEQLPLGPSHFLRQTGRPLSQRKGDRADYGERGVMLSQGSSCKEREATGFWEKMPIWLLALPTRWNRLYSTTRRQLHHRCFPTACSGALPFFLSIVPGGLCLPSCLNLLSSSFFILFPNLETTDVNPGLTSVVVKITLLSYTCSEEASLRCGGEAGSAAQPEANNKIDLQRDGVLVSSIDAQATHCLLCGQPIEERRYGKQSIMAHERMPTAKRKRLIRTYGPCPAGYTTAELESFLLVWGVECEHLAIAWESVLELRANQLVDIAEKQRLLL